MTSKEELAVCRGFDTAKVRRLPGRRPCSKLYLMKRRTIAEPA